MSFTAAGSFITSTTTSVSLNNQAVGDLILLEIENPDTTIWANEVNGGGVSWVQYGPRFTGTTNARSAVVYAGKVNATGSHTATVSFTGTPTNIRVVGQEFSSTLGSWAFDSQVTLDSSGTATWPTLTPSGPNELYFGYAVDASSAVDGSTTGYTYQTDSVGNGCAFDPNCSTATSPTWGDANMLFGVMVLIKEVTWSVLQSNSNGGNGSSINVNLGANLTAGTKLIALACTDSHGDGNIQSIDDGNGNSFTKVAHSDQGVGNGETSLWVLDTPAADVGTIPLFTVTASVSVNLTLLIQEVSGLLPGTGSIDGTPAITNGTSSGGLIGPPTYSSTTSGEFLVYAYGDDGWGNAYSGPLGYVIDLNSINDTGGSDLAIAYKSSRGGSEGGQFNLSGTQDYALIFAAFKTSSIVYNTGTSANASNASSVPFTIPSQVKAGDVMLLDIQCFTEDTSAPTISFSGGGGTWTLIPMSDGSPNPTNSNNSGIYAYGFAYQRVATAADIGAIVTVSETGSASGTTWWAVAMAAYTGANQVNPIDQAKSHTVSGQTVTTIAAPTVASRIAGDWAVCLFSGGIGASSTVTPPAGSANRQATYSGAGIAAAIADDNGPSGLRSIGGGSWSSSGGASNCWPTAFSICLAPAGIYLVGQSGFSPNNSTSPITITYNSAPGCSLIVSGYLYDSGSSTNYPTSITDSASNTWQLSTTTAAAPPTEQYNQAGNGMITTFIGWSLNASEITSLHVARQDTGSNWWRVNLTEWLGIAQADNSNIGTTGATTQSTYNLPSVTLNSGNELVVAIMANLSSSGGALPAGWTNLGTGFADWPQGAAYIIGQPAGSFSPLFTGGNTGSWLGCAAVFSPVTIPGGGITQNLTMFGIV